ncbi:AAA family ATPase [Rhodopirellula sp. MGV]|uniref:AAA family ATPase n=1 Tax=Rhodopirellula sp. MGV TaxID=2023130 RepID=UPI000B973953|nr:AAA family ATPase [Rhodopirellula sp. MGV]OYP36831.1 AAA family ATPase [Rhodopirellula sp. MGV]PNY36462.1 AAA family ATPase [Rhodopirellula baltica]
MAVRVDANELLELLELTPASQNVMLVGRHGIGKSQIITEYYAKRGMQVISFFLGQMSDPGDLIGLLHKDEATGRSEFLPPYWWPEDDQPITLFLDELNRARPEILQAVMELALNKTLAGKRLPEGSVIVSAVNDGDEYQLTDLDPALISRFNLYEFAPTVEDWLLWAERTGVDHRITHFIQQQPHFLDSVLAGSGASNSPPESDTGLNKTPDRRAWNRVSDFIRPIDQLQDKHIKLVAGIVGSAAASAFRRSLATQLAVSPPDVLFDLSKHRKTLNKMTLAELLTLNEQILIWLAGEKCPTDKEDDARKGLLGYLKLLRRRKLDEAVAHWVATLEKPKFESVMGFVSESLELTELLTSYMEGIRVE